MSDQPPVSVGRKTAVGASWMIAWRMFSRGLGMVSTLVLARILVPADFGLIAMATMIAGVIEGFSALGLDDALVRHHDPEKPLYDTAFSIQMIRCCANALLILASAQAATEWFEEPRLYPILLILAGLTAVSGLENIGIVDFRRQMRFDREFQLLFLPRIAGFVVTVACAVTMRSYWALVIGIAVSKLARLVSTYVVHPYRPHFALSRWRDLAGFSFWTWVGGLVELVWERMDGFIIGPVLGPARLGVFIIAFEIAWLPISELVSPAGRALFAGLSVAQRQGSPLVDVAMPVTSALLLVVLPLSLAISAAANCVTAVLLGPRWVDAGPLIAVFSALCVFSTFSFVGKTVLVAQARVRESVVAIALAAVVKAGIVLAAAQTGDMMVMAVASVATIGVESLMFMVQVHWRSGIAIGHALRGLGRIMISSAAAAAVLYLSGLGWAPSPAATLWALAQGAAAGLLAMAVFYGVQWALWRLAGRPEGPEAKMIALAGDFLGSRRLPVWGLR